MQLYSEAADVMAAGIQGGDDAPTVARQIELYRGLKPASLAPLPATDPVSPVQLVYTGLMTGMLTKEQLNATLSHEGFSSETAYDANIRRTLASSEVLRVVAGKSNLSLSIMIDVLCGNRQFLLSGDDIKGYAVIVTTPGTGSQHWYVLREAGAYRILGDDHDDINLGNGVLFELAHGNLARAKAILDWKRDLVHKAGGDDPFSGPLFPLFWTVDSTKEGADSPGAMRLAAISLLARSPGVKPYLADIAAARDKASGSRQADLDLLLANAAIAAGDAKEALLPAKGLLEQEPDSATALSLTATAFLYEDDPAGLLALLDPMLAKKPEDRDLLNQEVRAYEAENNFSAARTVEKKVLDSGKAEANDYNNYAWIGLFDHHVGDEEIKAAQQANMLSKNASFTDLHTLACLYAAQGRTTEARQLLKQAMLTINRSEPNSEVWYGLGLIYEQYGENAAALRAYEHVSAHEEYEQTYIDPTATYRLAQARINALRVGPS